MYTNIVLFIISFLLLFIIIWFSIIKQLSNVEGLETRSNVVAVRDGVKVKRRNNDKNGHGHDKIVENYEEGMLSAKSITKSVLKPITKFFVAIGTYLECGLNKIISLPYCLFWYLIDAFGQICYYIFELLFIILGDRSLAKQIWNVFDDIDFMIYEAAGFHILHFPETIIKKCYRCTPKIKKI